MKYRYDFLPEGIEMSGNYEVVDIVRDDGIRIRGGILYDTTRGVWEESWPDTDAFLDGPDGPGQTMIYAHPDEEDRLDAHARFMLRQLRARAKP